VSLRADPPAGLEPVSSSAFLELIGPLYLDAGADVPTYWARVEARHANTFGAAHGGYVAALVDVVVGRGTRRLLADGRSFRTVSMAIDYPAGAELDEWIRFTVALDHLARRTAFVTCRVTCGERLVARAAVVLSASSAPAGDPAGTPQAPAG
jgi:acyl-coenzyme A thioesterase PaaI-like protein